MKNRKIQINTLNCIIVDDEPDAADALEQLLLANGTLQVIAKINESRQALTSILQIKPDLVFLDIQMPVMSGFDILESLSQTEVKPFVIFVTAFDKFAIQAIRSSVFDYLLKPVDEGELTLAIERFIAQYNQKAQEVNYAVLLENASRKKIRFNTAGGFVLINPEDIVYIQADWNYSEIHFSKEEFELVTMNLGSVEEVLPAGYFARINRSVIINLAYLERIQRGKRMCILKKDGVTFDFKIPLLRVRYLEGLV